MAEIRPPEDTLYDDPDSFALAVSAEVAESREQAEANRLEAENAFSAYQDSDGTEGSFNLTEYLTQTPPTYGTIGVCSGSYANIGEVPVLEGDFSITLPTMPGEPALQPLSAIVLPESPEFFGVLPQISTLIVPSMLQVTLPTAPEMTDITLPEDILLTLPEVPSLADFELPELISVNLPEFTDMFTGSVSVPDIAFAWSETAYQTALLTKMQHDLLSLVTGDTYGIPAEVVTAMTDRARQRELELYTETVDSVGRVVRSRGFELPPKAFERYVQHALGTSLTKANTFVRDLDITVAELEQANIEFSLRSAIQLEGRMINLHNDVQRRSLEAAKFSVETLINLFKAEVRLYEADVEVFRIKLGVFRTLIEAQLARLGVFKAELEAQKTLLQINESRVRLYTGQLEGVKSLINLYKSQVEAANAVVEMNNAKVGLYEAKLEGFNTAVDVKISEYAVFAAQVKSEVQKAEIYKSQSSAYKSNVQAYEALVDAGIAASELEFKSEFEFPLELYKSRVEGFRTAVEAEVARIEAQSAKFKIDVDMFAAEVGAGTDMFDANTKVSELTFKGAIEASQINAASARSLASRVMTAANIAESAARARGQFQGQVEAARIAQRSHSKNRSENMSVSDSNSVSTSESHSHVKDKTDSWNTAQRTVNQTILRENL